MRKNAKPGDMPSSGRILGTYSADFGTRESVPTMPSMPSMAEETATLGRNGCISFRRQPEAIDGSLPVRTCQHDEVRRAASQDGFLIRKIRASRGLDPIPTSLPLKGAPAGSLARGSCPGGPKRKKASDSSHWLSPTPTPGEDRESQQTQLAISPNPCPRPVLRPEGCALPGPLGRPADPNSPGRIANSS